MISLVVLAAGASTRMGGHKLLLPLGGEPLVRRTVRQACGAGFDDVVVVLGREAESVRAALAGLPCRYAINEAYETGMGSSFRAAVDALGEADAAVFALADQPFVTADDYRRVREGYEIPGALAPGPQGEVPGRLRGVLIVCARFGDVTAPPHLFSRSLFDELRVLQEGARPVLTRHAAQSRRVDLPPDHLVDIDTPADYERAKRQLDV